MSGQAPHCMQLSPLLPGFDLGNGMVLRPSFGNRVFGDLNGTTSTTTTMRGHQPGALSGGGLK
jgi:hypothetical protein